MDKNAAPAFFLLPACIESNDDVFMDIFRAVKGRTSIEKSSLNRSFISGMLVPSIVINVEDLEPWKQLNSSSEQRRQAMMLGFWAIKIFPTLGARLCGERWNIPQRQCVNVVGKDSLTPDEFDLLIFRKIKLRIVEIYESESTLQRLKHFVKTPTDIGKENRVQLLNKIFSLDIEKSFVRPCWDALRSGAFSCDNMNGDVAVSFQNRF